MIPDHSVVRRVNQDLDRGPCKASRVTDFSLKDVNILGHLGFRGRVAPKVTQYDLRNVFLYPPPPLPPQTFSAKLNL